MFKMIRRMLVCMAVLMCMLLPAAVAEGYPESSHPYAKNTNKTWEYVHPVETYELKVTFSTNTEFEDGYDFLYIKDANGVEQKFTGRQLAGKTLTLPGYRFTLRLKSDSSENEYGFKITSIEEPDFVVQNGMLTGYTGDGGNITLPEVVKVIGTGAFSGYAGLTGVIIPDGVTAIQDNAFADCANLEEVVIPASVESISQTAFTGCAKLKLSVAFGSTAETLLQQQGFRYAVHTAFESEHPYSHNRDLSWVYRHPGNPAVLKVKFSAQTSVENGYDFIYMTQEDGTVTRYTSTELAGKTLTLPGRTFTLRLNTNASNAYWGFGIEYITGYSQAEHEQDQVNQTVFTMNDAGEITGYTGSSASVTIPASINGKPVTGIASRAFDYMECTSVTIPEGVEHIGDHAFYYCEQLKTVKLPEGLKSIGSYGFYNCTALTSIALPESLQSIGNYAFGNSALTAVNLGKNVQSVGVRAFYGSNVKSIAFTNSLTDIGTDAFICQATSVTVNETMLQNQLYSYFTSGVITTVNFAEGVTSTGPRTSILYGFDNLTTVVLPSTMEHIGEMAFHGHTKLARVQNTGSVKSIGPRAFENCTALTTFALPEGLTEMGEYAFCDTAMSSVTIPSTLKNVPDYAFGGCKIRTLNIQHGVESLGRYAFYSNPMTSVTVPASVKSIGSDVFYFCRSLKTVTLNEGLEELGLSAFMNCDVLETITVPASVKSIGSNAFHTCKALKSATIKSPSIALPAYLFSTCTALESLTLGGSVTGVGKDAFYNCNALKYVTFLEGATSIPTDMLAGHTALTSLTLPSTMKTIGANAFSGCTGLANVVLPTSLTSVGAGAFTGCTALTALVTENSPAHSHCLRSGIPVVTTEKNVSGTAVKNFGPCGDEAFFLLETAGTMTVWGKGAIYDYLTYDYTPWYSDKNTVTTLRIGEGITRVGDSAFDSLDDVTEIDLPSTLKEIGISSFYGCDRLTAITLPEGLEVIGQSAFNSLYSLTAIEIPSTVTTMDRGCFANSSVLTYAFIPHTVTSIASNSFVGALSPVVIACHEDSTAALTFKDQYTLALEPHAPEVIPAMPGNCTQDSLGEGSRCAICGKVLAEPVVSPAPGHAWGVPAFIWAEDASACTAVFPCANCDETFSKAAQVEEIGMSDPTCTEPGSTIYEASVTLEEEEPGQVLDSDKVFTEQKTLFNVPAKGHSEFTHPGFDPSCTEPGMTDFIFCAECGQVFQEMTEIPPKGHREEVTLPALAPTCTTSGHTEGTGCGVCFIPMKESTFVPALGHKEYVSAEGYDPTCTLDGLSDEISCSVCGDVVKPAAAVPPIGHMETAGEGISPDCVNPGRTEGLFCSVCGEALVPQEVIPALGHSPVTDDAVPPTNHEDGLTEGVHCGVCGLTLVEQTVIPSIFAWEGTTIISYRGEETNVAIPEDATALGDTVFRNNGRIVTVRVPDSVTTLGLQTFLNCTGLQDVYLPDNIGGITPQTFFNVTARIHASAGSAAAVALSASSVPFTTEDGLRVLYRVKGGAPFSAVLYGCETEQQAVVLPADIGGVPLTSIQASAFEHCPNLTRVTIPGAVTSMAPGTFDGCMEKPVILSPADAYARSWASVYGFPWEHDLHTQDILPGIPATHVTAGLSEGLWCSGCGEVFLEQQELEPVKVEMLRLPEGTREIHPEAFMGSGMVCVVVPEGCERIQARAFAHCTNLLFAEIPSSVTVLDPSAFEGCGKALVIVTDEGSEAQRLAQEQGILCVIR